MMLCRAIFLLLFCLPATLHAAEPFARSEWLTKGRIVAGQQIELAVDVFAPNFFKSAPDFPLFELKDAIVALPDQRALNRVVTVDGVQYSGIRKSYMVMAERAGDFTLPAIIFSVAYANDDGATATGKAAVPALSFTADAVPGDWAGQTPLVADGVTIEQHLDHDPATLKAGDALVRRVSISVDGTQPMMIPAPDFAAPAGIKLYRADPRLDQPGFDNDDPDAARRTEAVTYVVEKAGVVTLPPVDVKWFNPATGKIETAEAPAVKLEVKDNPAPKQVIPAGDAPGAFDRDANRRAVNALLFHTMLRTLTALALFAIAYYLFSRLEAWWEEAKRRRAEAEPAYYRKLEAALSGKEPMAAWRAFDTWARRLGFGTAAECAASAGNVALSHAFEGLERSLFGGGARQSASDSMKALRHNLPEGRRRLLRARGHGSIRQMALPPLNP